VGVEPPNIEMPPPSQEEPREQAVITGETPPTGPPAYDPAAVGRIAQVVEIQTVELIGAHFDRVDEGPLPDAALDEATPDLGVFAEWGLSTDRHELGCLIHFAATFDDNVESDDPEDEPLGPYYLFARFRVLYRIAEDGADLSPDDVAQFVMWNAVFNAWPYWREYLSSTINRAQLPRFLVPVMGVPRA
jgi:hypothetical protein